MTYDLRALLAICDWGGVEVAPDNSIRCPFCGDALLGIRITIDPNGDCQMITRHPLPACDQAAHFYENHGGVQIV